MNEVGFGKKDYDRILANASDELRNAIDKAVIDKMLADLEEDKCLSTSTCVKSAKSQKTS